MTFKYAFFDWLFKNPHISAADKNLKNLYKEFFCKSKSCLHAKFQHSNFKTVRDI